MAKDPRFIDIKIIILIFYKGQLLELRARTARLWLQIKIFEVISLTVASSQGTEFNVVLLSFVKTRGVKFINEPKALLVALTRASKLLGIYSNDNLTSDIT
jgi:superfamily I DNA and/or RNA helicase